MISIFDIDKVFLATHVAPSLGMGQALESVSEFSTTDDA
jgi:hypothetical protein